MRYAALFVGFALLGSNIGRAATTITVTSTAQRLRGAAGATNLGADVEAMIDGFYFIQQLRLRQQQGLKGEEAGANRIDPDELNELDRFILKEAFKQARKLQEKLKLDYRL